MKESIRSRLEWTIRRARPVTEHMILRNGLEEDLYYLCPNCRIFLPREYMRFCDCCGQRLNWDMVAERDRLWTDGL